ncbi:IucA/IucC family protein [Streptomyces sp. NPDC059850]|uniref:IucA/IucC family protein n=1 Tax=Streptomyces sp. NPDC059850 TaxID=3346970 RepID=UPI00365A9A8B
MVANTGSGATEAGRAERPDGRDAADGGGEPGQEDRAVAAGPRDGAPAVVLRGLGAVLGRLRGAVAEEDRELYDVFVGECHRALDATRLHDRVRPGVVRGLAVRYGESGRWAGMAGAVAYDTLAAFRDHPVYPTSRGRSVFTEDALRAHAPEFAPGFGLRWLALPRTAIGGDPERLPAWWPSPGELGLPARLDADHLAFPVHPLTVGSSLTDALDATGLRPRAQLAEGPWLDVRPTLSMRTVAVDDDPLTHLKLPLTTATLGMRNRRTVKPGTLVDGEVAQRLVEEVISREPRFKDTVLLADETTHLHAGHELLATLVRRYPPGLENAQVVPVAGLLARTPDGRLVADVLAERHYGGDLLALFDAYLTLLFDFHTTLFAYGIALESHQQNTSLVFDGTGGPATPRLRLLIKDHDGPRVHAIRLAAMIGGGEAADLCGFDDRRILTGGDGPVADVFTTITVHLCAAAPAFELATLGRAPLDALLRRLRDRLGEAVERTGAVYPGRAAAVLRARVLGADRLPVKAMVSAGTLFTKARSGAADVNKHYVTGPNYLLRGRGR